jgi:hypothetical protein
MGECSKAEEAKDTTETCQENQNSNDVEENDDDMADYGKIFCSHSAHRNKFSSC